MRSPLVALLAAFIGMAAVPGPASAQEVPGAEVALRLRDPRILESSGLALSRRHPGVLWTHNDSGDRARLFAVGPDGRTRAVLTLAGVEARDWEALAPGRDDHGRPALFVGDIGDNNGVWPEVAVYRVAEPARLGDATVPSVRYRLGYPDGSHNAEALLVDPRSNRLYLATKAVTGAALYQAPARLRGDRLNLLRRVARVPPIVTDGAFAPDGRSFVLRDYQGAFVYTTPGHRVGAFDLPLQVQGESIAVSPDGRSVLTGSEGPHGEVWRVPLPAAILARVTPATNGGAGAAPARAGPPATGGGVRWAATPVLGVAAAALVLLVALAGLGAWRRRRV
jgi:hypothetical protein